MKTYFGLLVVAIALLSACSAPQGATSSKNYQDDIYYSSKDAAADRDKLLLQKQRENEELAARKKENEAPDNRNATTTSEDDYYQAPKNSERGTDSPSSTTSSTATSGSSSTASFDYDDYYDYEYAVRLRRFHNNIPTYGYYDTFYTNAYWYTGDPYYYGTSVYMGYNFWGPSYYTYSYNPRFNWYVNWGWGYDPFYNPYAYHPYYYHPYYGYNPYGCYNGWNNCYVNNYFNSYDRNSYYGPRNSGLSAGGRRTSESTLAHRYMNAVERETQKPFSETGGRKTNPYLHTPTRPSTHNQTESVDPSKMEINIKEPVRNPVKQTHQNNNAVELPIEPEIKHNQPVKNQHINSNQPAIEINEHNTGVQPIREVDKRKKNNQINNTEQLNQQLEPNNTVPPRQLPQHQNNQQLNDMEQPSREPRSPQFDQPRNNNHTPRGGSSNPNTTRPRR